MTAAKETPPTWSSRIESIAKAGAFLTAAVYGVGFTVISLYQGQYGIFAVEVFRPRVFAAGFVFIALVTLSTITAYQVFRLGAWAVHSSSEPGRRMQELIATTPFYLVGCSLISIYTSGFLQEKAMAVNHSVWYDMVWFGALLASVGLYVGFKRHPNLVAFGAATFVVAMILAKLNFTMTIERHPKLTGGPSDWLTVWLFFAGLVAADFHYRLREGNRMREQWAVPVLWIILILSSYATVVYPNVKTAFGGGVAADVTIYFRGKGALGGEGQTLATSLLDENEHGFYVTTAARRAYFIPRDEIAYIKFERHTGAE